MMQTRLRAPATTARRGAAQAAVGLAVAALLAGCGGGDDDDRSDGMGFFVTSSGLGNGANLGGLDGADRHCQALAATAGSGDRTWRAYLGQQATATAPAVNARDRIGQGPWRNAAGTVIARDLTQLHDANDITKATALTERGAVVNGRGDTPNTHDVLTGSNPDGTVVAGTADATCGNWTRNGDGAAMLGHHDRAGLDESAAARSWNSSHLSRGCSATALTSTGGAGLYYCFAAD